MADTDTLEKDLRKMGVDLAYVRCIAARVVPASPFHAATERAIDAYEAYTARTGTRGLWAYATVDRQRMANAVARSELTAEHQRALVREYARRDPSSEQAQAHLGLANALLATANALRKAFELHNQTCPASPCPPPPPPLRRSWWSFRDT